MNRNNFENLYYNELENLVKFLETHDIPKLYNEDVEYFNRLIPYNEIEVEIKNLPTKKS